MVDRLMALFGEVWGRVVDTLFGRVIEMIIEAAMRHAGFDPAALPV